jgi:hypothetical protein
MLTVESLACSTMAVLGLQGFRLLNGKLNLSAMTTPFKIRLEGTSVLDLVRSAKLPLVLLTL